MAIKFDPDAKQPLINATAGSHSCLKLFDDANNDLSGWDVKKKNPGDTYGTITDNHGGEWTAKVCTKPKPKKNSQLWLMLKCVTAPRTADDKRGPDGGDLSITLTNAGATQTVAAPTTVDYSNDTPP